MMRYAKNNAYTEKLVKFLWNVETHDFNGDLSTLELALMHRMWIPTFLHPYPTVVVVPGLHRVGD